LDVSKVTKRESFKGLEIELRRHSGARVLRVVHPGRQAIEEHRHDWAYIGLYTLGSYREIYEDGEALMRGPSVALHPADRPHADEVGDAGLETLAIEFDPAWLRARGYEAAIDRSRIWTGGSVALATRRFARTISRSDTTESDLAAATFGFLKFALAAQPVAQPSWLRRVDDGLTAPRASTVTIARTLDLHPAWLARAYRAATGEGIHETLRRKRVERACALLRRSDAPLADVAQAAGFCDQSHMNRVFHAVIGRTPQQVRRESLVATP
jgi:AraC family transcriptional regulator